MAEEPLPARVPPAAAEPLVPVPGLAVSLAAQAERVSAAAANRATGAPNEEIFTAFPSRKIYSLTLCWSGRSDQHGRQPNRRNG